MNYARILSGGLVGGVVFNIISFVINAFGLMGRYTVLQSTGVLRAEPRGFFLPGWMILLFGVSIACVWLYAVARPRLGPGPKTALLIGLVAGAIGAIPCNYSTFAWAYTGGFLATGWTLNILIGCMGATLAGAWMYKE